jgi:lysine 2,3-aminomutase
MNASSSAASSCATRAVLIAGVNDTPETMTLLVKRLGHVNVHPYYVYVHDMVKGVEDLRTSVDTAIHIEKHVRGMTAASTRPRSSSTRRAAAASATRTRTSTTTATPASASTRRRA